MPQDYVIFPIGNTRFGVIRPDSLAKTLDFFIPRLNRDGKMFKERKTGTGFWFPKAVHFSLNKEKHTHVEFIEFRFVHNFVLLLEVR